MKKRIISAILVTAMILGCVGSAAADTDVTSGTQKSKSGKTISVVTVPMPAGSGRRLETLSAGGVVTADTNADNFVSTAKSGGKTLLAMVNGAYFNSYYNASADLVFPDNCAKIQGTLVTNGRSVSSGGQTMVAFNSQGKCLIDAVEQKAEFNVDGKTVTAWGINSYYSDSSAVMIFTPEVGMTVPMAQGAVGYVVVNGVVTAELTAPFNVKSGETVYVFNKSILDNYKSWDTHPKIGSKITLRVRYVPSRSQNASDWNNIVSATGAGPLLVLDGKTAVDSSANESIFKDPKQTPDTVSQRTYIGVKADGTVVIGEGSISFYDLADTLISMGVVDAMALDGGASSCVYVEGKGYIQKAGRKLNNVIAIVEGGTAAPAPPEEPASKVVNPTASTVYVNGEATEFEAYTIDGSNYFKLRDVAMAVNGTEKQFDATYDSDTKAINLISGKEYTPAGGELAKGDGKSKTATPTASKIHLDGEELSLTVYTINGNNFFKLRDLMKALNVYVGYDNATKNITIDTSKEYVE